MAKKKISKDVLDTLNRRLARERRREFNPNDARSQMHNYEVEIEEASRRLREKIEAVSTFVEDLRSEIETVRGRQYRHQRLQSDLAEFEANPQRFRAVDYRRDREDRREARRA